MGTVKNIVVAIALSTPFAAFAAPPANTVQAVQDLKQWCKSSARVELNQVVPIDPANPLSHQIRLGQGQAVIVDISATDLMAPAMGDPQTDIEICAIVGGTETKIFPASQSSYFAAANPVIPIADGVRVAFIAPMAAEYVVHLSKAFESGKGLAGQPAELLIRERVMTDVKIERLDIAENSKGGRTWVVERNPDATSLGDVFWFEGTAGDVAEITLKSRETGSDFDPMLQVAPPGLTPDSPDAFSLLRMSDNAIGPDDETVRIRMNKSGRYEISAGTSMFGIGPYALELKIAKAERVTPKELKIGEQLDLKLSEEPDEQQFSFMATSNQKLILNIGKSNADMPDFTIKTSLGTTPDFQVLNEGVVADPEKIWGYEEFVSLEATREIIIKPERTGKIFVKVEPFGATGKVRFELNSQ